MNGVSKNKKMQMEILDVPKMTNTARSQEDARRERIVAPTEVRNESFNCSARSPTADKHISRPSPSLSSSTFKYPAGRLVSSNSPHSITVTPSPNKKSSKSIESGSSPIR